MTHPNSSRRGLLKGLAATVAAMPFASSIAKEYKPDEKWDREVDVLVIGFGAAGAVSAITAHDEGSSVLVLEKLAKGGGFIIPSDAEKAFDYLSRTYDYAQNDWDPDVLRAFCHEASGLKDFMKRIAPQARLGVYGHGTFPQLPNSDSVTKYSVRGRASGGRCLFDVLQKAVVDDRHIEVLYNTPAKRLIRRGEEVVGAEVEAQGKLLRIKAAKGVILATGGFEADKESLQNFCLGTDVRTMGSPGNTGDGLRMAMSMGAKLWHMTSYTCPLGIEIPGHKALYGLGIKGKSFIWVNRLGQRFVNEAGVDIHNCLYSVNKLDTLHRMYSAIPCWMIFDEDFRKSGPASMFMFGYAIDTESYRWSQDNMKEIESGVIKQASTLSELAKIIDVPAENLEKTVAKWNADISKGDDLDFGRKQKGASKGNANAQFAPSLSAPLSETGPYYAIKLLPALFHTNGGPKRDANSNVVDVENKPIARLYVAGELGSIWGTIQQGSTNLAECLAFGQIAGRNASKLSRWG